MRCEFTPDGWRWVPIPDITPFLQETWDCWAYWDVKVLMDPDRSTILRMAFGDGSAEDRTIPQGSGTTTISFQHYFDPGTIETVQRATVLETGYFDQSTTYHHLTTTSALPATNEGVE